MRVRPAIARREVLLGCFADIVSLAEAGYCSSEIEEGDEEHAKNKKNDAMIRIIGVHLELTEIEGKSCAESSRHEKRKR